jgi:hypothetical protein
VKNYVHVAVTLGRKIRAEFFVLVKPNACFASNVLTDPVTISIATTEHRQYH